MRDSSRAPDTPAGMTEWVRTPLVVILARGCRAKNPVLWAAEKEPDPSAWLRAGSAGATEKNEMSPQMKPFILALLAAVSLLGAVGFPQAGVVIEEQRVQTRRGEERTQHRTMMIEGKKRKIAGEESSIITDFDTGKVVLVSVRNKSYLVFRYSPEGLSSTPDDRFLMADLKKTGEHRTVAGYPCDVYSGRKETPAFQMSVTACLSNQVPGAADFTAFEKLLAARLKNKASAGQVPDGVPLSTEATTKVKPPRSMEPRLAQEFSKRPPGVTKITVTKIHAEKLSPDNFKPPEGYRRRRISGRFGARP